MKKTDLEKFERRVKDVEFIAPDPPDAQTIYRFLVKDRSLWSAREYAYIKRFHEMHGFDLQYIFWPLAVDEYAYWHSLAVERYQMSEQERQQVYSTIPIIGRTWSFHQSKLRESKKKPYVWMSHNRAVIPFSRQELEKRGWQSIWFDHDTPGNALLYSSELADMWCYVELETNITVLFSGKERLDDVHYYLAHKEELRQKNNVRYEIAAQDLTVDEIDPEFEEEERKDTFNFRWEDGSLVPGSRMDELLRNLAHRKEKRSAPASL